MLAYNVAASKMARPTCRFLSFSTSFDWHQKKNEIRNLDNATRDYPSIPDGVFLWLPRCTKNNETEFLA